MHPVRETVITAADEHRSMEKVSQAVLFSYNGDPFQRIIYSESHDEVANGKRASRPKSTSKTATTISRKRNRRSRPGSSLPRPGIPMLFQGQEFLSGGWFQDTVPLDWDQTQDYRGILRLYRDLDQIAAEQRSQHARSMRTRRANFALQRPPKHDSLSIAGMPAGWRRHARRHELLEPTAHRL